MSKHFVKDGDQYLLTPAAVLLMISDEIQSADNTMAGKERFVRIISQIMEVARRMRFEQADSLETMLLFGADPAQLLAVCDELVHHIGGWVVLAIVRRVAATGHQVGEA